ncbi:MAG TPA: hypothetical protein VLE50_06350 [Cellvibrio sp.]|nr:hypothetical protein [Cellvibrio sp.]
MVDVVAPSLSLTHRSPGLTAIYNEIKGSRVNHVLDLGASSARSFNFFAQLSCKIRFENLTDVFARNSGDALQKETLLEQLAHYIDDRKLKEHFDLVLAWDLFNYLDLAGVEWFTQKLSVLCGPNALIHSVRYLGANIPMHPQTFQIVNQYQVMISEVAETAPRHHASHDTARLLKLMPDFYLESTYLNFDGMIPGLMENVLRFQPQKTLSGRRQSSDELNNLDVSHVSPVHQRDLQPHISPALANVFGSITAAPTILDLGQKTRQNFDFLYSITQHIYAENLHQELQLQEKAGGEVHFKAHMLNFPAELRFDIILLWDTLNFLSPDIIEKLFDRLRPWLHENTVIHAIVYSGKEIPANPQQFFMRTPAALDVCPSGKKVATDPLTSSRLLKLMKTFRLEETFVFRPGMQRGIYEYLFRSQR